MKENIRKRYSNRKNLEYTPEQKEIIQYEGETPMLVLAGPGTGKTFCLIERVKFLLDTGFEAENIIFLTLTNAVVEDMIQKLEEESRRLKKKEIARVRVSTVHGLSIQILREFFKSVGLRSNFTFLDDFDEELILEDMSEDLNVSKEEALGFIELKDRVICSKKFTRKELEESTRYFKKYDKLIKFYNALTFSDAVFKITKLLSENEGVRERWKGKYKYILVDEYQDLNKIEQDFINLVTENGRGLLVVGDPDQSIYSFRHAYPEGIDNFKKPYPNAITKYLSVSHRCRNKFLIEAFNYFIKHNKQNKHRRSLKISKRISNILNSKIKIFEAPSVVHRGGKEFNKEVDWVIEQIREIVKKKPWQEFGACRRKYRIYILAVRRKILIPFLDRLKDEKINQPEILERRGGTRAPKKKFRLLLSFIDLLIDSRNNLALRRVMKDTRINAKSIKRIRNMAETKQVSLRDALREYLKITHGKSTSKDTAEKEFDALNNSLGDLERFSEKETGARKTLEYICDTLAEVKEKEKNYLLQQVEKDVSLRQLKNEVLLAIKAINEETKRDSLESDSSKFEIKLATLHSSKGLNSDIVFIVGAEEKFIPNGWTGQQGFYEKLRLFYVGMTRVREQLFISYAKFRQDPLTRGRGGKREMSRFLKDSYIPSKFKAINKVKKVRNNL